MMRKVLGYAGIVLLSLVLGAGSAVYVCWSPGGDQGEVRNGAWTTSLSVGGTGSGMYERAWVAANGLFAMTKSEAVYFRGHLDTEGNPLRTDCDYVIEGVDPDARWWSVTVYGADNYLVPNAENRWAYSGGSVVREKDGSFRIHLSSKPQEKNWLPTGSGPEFSLTLRLYNPGKDVYQNPATTKLPVLRKVACQ